MIDGSAAHFISEFTITTNVWTKMKREKIQCVRSLQHNRFVRSSTDVWQPKKRENIFWRSNFDEMIPCSRDLCPSQVKIYNIRVIALNLPWNDEWLWLYAFICQYSQVFYGSIISMHERNFIAFRSHGSHSFVTSIYCLSNR